MGKAWAAVRVWWQGKKTILGGALVMAAGAAGIWYGKLDPVSGLAVVGFGLSIAGYSAKVNRHQAELLAALGAISQAGADARAGKLSIAGDLVPGISSVGQAAAPGLIAGAGASLHLSADTAAELAVAIQHMAGNTDMVLPSAPNNLTPISGGAAK